MFIAIEIGYEKKHLKKIKTTRICFSIKKSNTAISINYYYLLRDFYSKKSPFSHENIQFLDRKFFNEQKIIIIINVYYVNVLIILNVKLVLVNVIGLVVVVVWIIIKKFIGYGDSERTFSFYDKFFLNDDHNFVRANLSLTSQQELVLLRTQLLVLLVLIVLLMLLLFPIEIIIKTIYSYFSAKLSHRLSISSLSGVNYVQNFYDIFFVQCSKRPRNVKITLIYGNDSKKSFCHNHYHLDGCNCVKKKEENGVQLHCKSNRFPPLCNVIFNFINKLFWLELSFKLFPNNCQSNHSLQCYHWVYQPYSDNQSKVYKFSNEFNQFSSFNNFLQLSTIYGSVSVHIGTRKCSSRSSAKAIKKSSEENTKMVDITTTKTRDTVENTTEPKINRATSSSSSSPSSSKLSSAPSFAGTRFSILHKNSSENIFKKHFYLLLLVFTTCVPIISATMHNMKYSTNVVNTKYGQLRGIVVRSNPTVEAYLGVPYASPPVGSLR